MTARVHLAVCVPAESMPIESVRCLTRMLLEIVRNPPSPIDGQAPRDFTLSEHYYASSMLPQARSWLLESASSSGATHALLLDSDMTYPPDVAHRLMSGVARCGGFVAANCPTRRRPIRWTARLADGSTLDSSSPDLPRWTAVRAVGVAVAMISLELWAKLERPAFNFGLTPRGWIGEDIWFCERLVAAGASPVVDNHVSRQIGHVGAHEFTAADIEATP